MKTAILSSLVLISSFVFLVARSQTAPYLTNPQLPEFSILGSDSSTWITKASIKTGRPVMMILFSPDCEHCQKQTALLTKNMKQFEQVQIVMATYQPIFKMKAFAKQYKLNEYPNIMMGRDVMYFFGPYYQLKSAPFIAVYNKNRQLVKAFDGGASIEKLQEAINQ